MPDGRRAGSVGRKPAYSERAGASVREVICLRTDAGHLRVEVREAAERIALERPHVQLVERGESVAIGHADEIHEVTVDARGRRRHLALLELRRPIVRELNELDTDQPEETVAERLVDERLGM